MHLAIVALVVALAACTATPSVEIVVSAPPDQPIDEVRLYMGVGDPFAPDTKIVPGGYRYPAAPPPGDAWQRAPGGEADVLAVDDTGQVTFRFQATSELSRLGIVVVVGFRSGKIVAAGILRNVTFEAGQLRRHAVTLAAATAPAADLATRPAFGVHIWGPTAEEQHCVHVMRGAEPSVFIVDKDDRDCDGIDDTGGAECVAEPMAVWNRLVRPQRAALSCFARDVPTGPVPNACMLGGTGCIDGSGKQTCAPGNTCVPEKVCSVCGPDLACAAIKGMSLPHVQCQVFAAPQTAPPPAANTLQLCTEKLELRGSNVGSIDAICDGPARFLTPPSTSFANEIVITGSNSAEAHFTSTGCSFALQPSGTIAAGTYTSFGEVAYANGRGLALPIVITVNATTACPGPDTISGCKLDDFVQLGQLDTGLLDCVRAKPVAPW